MRKTLFSIFILTLFVTATPAFAIINTDTSQDENKKESVAKEAKNSDKQVAETMFKKTNGDYDREAIILRIRELVKQLQELRSEMLLVEKEIRTTLSSSLKEGMENDDIREIQKLLATDPAIYPEGLTTGYYGSLTKAALMRFQEKHNLTATGKIDKDTRVLLEAYLAEKFGDNIPVGLLRAPGIQKKVEEKLCEKSQKEKGSFCAKVTKEEKDKVTEKKDEKKDKTDYKEPTLDIEVVVRDDTAYIHITYGYEYETEIEFTSEEAVINYIVELKGFTRSDVADVIEFEYEGRS